MNKIVYFDHKPNLFRLIFGILAIALLVITLNTLYRYTSVPTDENWFTNTPSRFYVTKTIPGFLVEHSTIENNSEKLIPDSIRVGNLILAMDRKRIDIDKNIDQFYQSIPDDSVFSMTVFRLSLQKNKFQYLIKRSALPDSFVRRLPPTVHVFDVIKGGASDRAGMQVGDLIVKINGKNFTDMMDADRIMRSARAGKTIDYEVIRNNRTITLHVTLARFGFDTSLLIPFICGLMMMGVAIFIGQKSPQLKAARLVGLALLLFGFALTIGYNKPPYAYHDFFSALRNVLFYLSLWFGIAFWLDSVFFFPKEWTEVLKVRWLRIVPYLFALIVTTALIILFFKFGARINESIPIIIAIILVYNFVVHFIFRKRRPKELRNLSRGIARTIYFSFFAIFILNYLLQYLNLSKLNSYTIILVLFVPVAYIYTIGRYHLLDMDLHIRKNVQYSIWSLVWASVLGAGFIFILIKLLSLNLNIPRFRLTLTSFEILDGVMSPQRRDYIEKIIIVVGSIISGLFLWRIRQKGQKFIDRKYYRTQFNYQHFSRELAEVMATKLGMVDLAKGIVQRLTELMNLKRSGILLFRDGKICCFQTAYDYNGNETNELFCDVDQKFVKFLYDFRTDARLSVDYLPENIQDFLSQNGFRHIIPIWFKDKLNGILLIGERLSEIPFHAEDLSFFTTVAKQASVSIENAFLYEQLAEKERLKHELEIARRIQLASLPQTTPSIKGMDIAGISIPAAEVGGDYFDYLNGAPDTLTVIVGDVSGKGTSAALYLFKIQGILRSLYGFGLTPRELFIRANQLLYRDLEKSSFVTAIGGYFDTQKNQLILARAGHLPLFYYCSQSHIVEKLTPKGLGLGLDRQDIFSSEIEERSIRYQKNDVFVFVTDGITEAKSSDGKEFGEENLINALKKNYSESAKRICDNIILEVSGFALNAPQYDDQTVVVVKAI